MKIFFVTDIHGSNMCYRKFLNALKIYKADVGILLGDLTGKMLIPFFFGHRFQGACMPVWGHHQVPRIVGVAIKNDKVLLSPAKYIILRIIIFLRLLTQNTPFWFI